MKPTVKKMTGLRSNTPGVQSSVVLRPSGFTLIEVLLAVAVFSIVLAAINSVFFAALRLRNRSYAAFDKALPIQQAIAIVKRDLEGIMFPGGPLAGSFQTTSTNLDPFSASIGLRVSPDFSTTSGYADSYSPWSEVQKVAYFLAPSTNNSVGKDLIRSVHHNLLPVMTDEPVKQWLMGGVESMGLSYFDGLVWTEVWDSSTATNLPKAIKVQISLVQDVGRRTVLAPVELIVPVLVQGVTNSTTTGG